MRTRTLGSSGLEVGEVGLGCMPMSWVPRKVLGVVRLDGDRAVWDESLGAVMEAVVRDHIQQIDLNPARGREFILALPNVFRNPPYCWAEVFP